MDIPAILAKIAGAILLLWTLRSIYRHFKDQKIAQEQKKQEVQSVSEQILNNILLYLWLAFMVIFSSGMILNN